MAWGRNKGTTRLFKNFLAFFVMRIENSIVARQGQPPYPPIFIVGPSRSGSTLLAQILVNGLELSYFRNFMIRFHKAPVCATYLSRILGFGNATECSFSSFYGKTKTGYGICTGSKFWKKWFADGNGRTTSEICNDIALHQLIGTITCIERIYRKPFVNKWTGNSARVTSLANIFPTALFIRMRRDPLLVAQSMLIARRQPGNDLKKSFVSWPVEFDQPEDIHYTENISRHLCQIEQTLDEAENKIGKERIISVWYKELCDSPKKVIEKVRRFYNKNCGFELKTTGNSIPTSFEYSNTIKIDSNDYKKLKKCLEKLNIKYVCE